MHQPDDIYSNIQDIQSELAAITTPLPVDKMPCHLLAASKSRDKTAIETAISGGIRLFGENKVQEAQAKWPEIKAQHPNVQLHLIGALQSNKAEEAVGLFDVIQTLDREKLADALAKTEEKLGLKRRYLVQVNTGEEEQKAGIWPQHADNFIRYCQNDVGLSVVGLMCIPPAGTNPAPHFALLRSIAERHGLKELSMGMSSDYKVAAKLGATMVRIGTGIFGERPSIK